jgi:hypothetical protein
MLALSAVEELAVTELADDAANELLALVRRRATALAGDAVDGTSGASVRRRSLAKAAAIAEAQLQQFEALLAGAVARKDSATLVLLDRAATGAAKRFALLMDALRADEQKYQRPVVVVGAANAVNIGSGG